MSTDILLEEFIEFFRLYDYKEWRLVAKKLLLNGSYVIPQNEFLWKNLPIDKFITTEKSTFFGGATKFILDRGAFFQSLDIEQRKRFNHAMPTISRQIK